MVIIANPKLAGSGSIRPPPRKSLVPRPLFQLPSPKALQAAAAHFGKGKAKGGYAALAAFCCSGPKAKGGKSGGRKSSGNDTTQGFEVGWDHSSSEDCVPWSKRTNGDSWQKDVASWIDDSARRVGKGKGGGKSTMCGKGGARLEDQMFDYVETVTDIANLPDMDEETLAKYTRYIKNRFSRQSFRDFIAGCRPGSLERQNIREGIQANLEYFDPKLRREVIKYLAGVNINIIDESDADRGRKRPRGALRAGGGKRKGDEKPQQKPQQRVVGKFGRQKYRDRGSRQHGGGRPGKRRTGANTIEVTWKPPVKENGNEKDDLDEDAEEEGDEIEVELEEDGDVSQGDGDDGRDDDGQEPTKATLKASAPRAKRHKAKSASPMRGPAGRGRGSATPAWMTAGIGQTSAPAIPIEAVAPAGRGRANAIPAWKTKGITDTPPTIPEELEGPVAACKEEPDLLAAVFDERDTDITITDKKGRGRRGRKGKGEVVDDEDDCGQGGGRSRKGRSSNAGISPWKPSSRGSVGKSSADNWEDRDWKSQSNSSSWSRSKDEQKQGSWQTDSWIAKGTDQDSWASQRTKSGPAKPFVPPPPAPAPPPRPPVTQPVMRPQAAAHTGVTAGPAGVLVAPPAHAGAAIGRWPPANVATPPSSQPAARSPAIVVTPPGSVRPPSMFGSALSAVAINCAPSAGVLVSPASSPSAGAGVVVAPRRPVPPPTTVVPPAWPQPW